jgi:hypothetical protein
VADEVTPDLDTAVVAVGGGVAIEAVGWSREEALDLAVQVRPVGFDRNEVIGALRPDGFGDLGLAAHGVEGDESARQREAFQQQRDGGDLIRLGVGGFLSEHQALPGGPGRDEMQRLATFRPVVRAACGLAVDGHDVGLRSRATPRPRPQSRS